MQAKITSDIKKYNNDLLEKVTNIIHKHAREVYFGANADLQVNVTKVMIDIMKLKL